MYSSLLGVAWAYLGLVCFVCVVLSCVTCTTCGVFSFWQTAFFLADLVFLSGVLWQANIYENDGAAPAEKYGEMAVTFLFLLAAASTAFVASSRTLTQVGWWRTRWVLVLCRLAFAVVVVYALFPGTASSFTILTARAGVWILLFLGIALIPLLPCVVA